jgi:hypothetical protein
MVSICTLHVLLADDPSDMRLFLRRDLAFMGHGHKSLKAHGQRIQVC